VSGGPGPLEPHLRPSVDARNYRQVILCHLKRANVSGQGTSRRPDVVLGLQVEAVTKFYGQRDILPEAGPGG